MALTLKLNRGASYTTINLNDVTNYRVLDTWNPRIATRKVTQFGGEPYKDVIESIPLYIKGSTAAVVLEKIEDILAAMEQAYAWKLGAVVDPVLLEYLPNGSSLGAVVQAAVLGTPADAADMLELAQLAMYMTGNSFETIITLPLWRRGLWLGAAETPAASSAVTNPGAMSVTFANSLRIPSPVKLVFGDAGSYTAFSGSHAGYILVADVADKIVKAEAPTAGGGIGGWTSVGDATASGASYNKINLASGDDADGQESITINTNARLFAIFASVHNLSETYSYLLKARLRGIGFATNWTLPRVLEVGMGGAPDIYPRIEFLGFIAAQAAVSVLEIYASGPGATGAGNELAFDYFIVMAVDENTAAIGFSNVDNFTFRRMAGTTVDHRLLTAPQPRLTYLSGSDVIDFAFRQGDLYLNSIGTNLTAWVIGTDPVNLSWCLRNSAGKIDFTTTATRTRGLLSLR